MSPTIEYEIETFLILIIDDRKNQVKNLLYLNPRLCGMDSNSIDVDLAL
jgi:hypothetical protein